MGRRKKGSRKTTNISRNATCSNKAPEETSISDGEKIAKEEKTDLCTFENVIDVYSRLKLPFVQSTHQSIHHRLSSDSDEEDIVELNFWPRFVFVSNLCLICMKQSREICEYCGLVSYCDDKHKKKDWPRHRGLCRVLAEVCAAKGGLSLLPELTPNDYRVYRLKLLEIVECRLGRQLELWEREIVLYPRVCYSCRYFSKALKCCTSCGIGLFCENHNDGHGEWCREFRIFRRVLYMQHENGYINPEIPDTFQRNPLHLPDNFDSLMARLYDNSAYYRSMDCYTYCSLSHISTIPLTTLYSTQISCKNWEALDAFVVHVIGAEFQFECINLHVWEELFLHFLPNLRNLRLMFVGPELNLPTIPLDLLTAVKLCSACKLSDRRVNVSFHPGQFYHDFFRSEQFIKPDLVCLFNPGLYRETGFKDRDTWPETIKEFCKTQVPVSVTAYTKHEIPREVIRIKSVANVETILEAQRNPFASIKPDRNFVSDDSEPLIYKNYYIAIVKGKS